MAFEYYVLAAMVGGTIMQAQGEARQAKEQAKWMKYRAGVQTAQAAEERKAASFAAGQKREEGRRLVARQLVLYGKAGVVPQVGTPLITMAETAAAVERDVRLIEIGGKRRGRFRESEAAISMGMAKATTRAGRWAAGTTLLTGLGGAGMDYYRWKGTTPSKGYTSEGRATILRY